MFKGTAINHNHSVHSGQTVVFTTYTIGSAFDILARHSTSTVIKILILHLYTALCHGRKNMMVKLKYTTVLLTYC